jgi:mono/diheme cytochrome c family protein
MSRRTNVIGCQRSFLTLGFVALWFLPSPVRAGDKLEYVRDVRPILAENCFACHGPDSAARKAKLRLDLRDEAIAKDAIVPGKPDQSGLVERIFAEDPGEIMPPPKSHKKLTSAQKETLKRWIAEGAAYQSHWAFIAPKRPQPPAVKNGRWVRNPIDNFILAELEKKGLQPAPEADRRTLARRLSLDLTGLPPEPEEVEAFINDKAPDAYERYVDRLLKKPAWGEHRGRYWLDAARYADTHGIHFDNFREIWAYRDWVINAFNRNLPFDRFTIEQLAGDLLPNRTLEQQIASGFNRCNITTNEGGVIPEEYLVLYTRDRTETTSAVWLGLTANCAVCHDHKFDPLTQKEFYSMAAFFNNTTQGAMDGNIKDTPPIVFVPRPEDRPRWEALSKELAEARKQVEARKQAARPEFDRWLTEAKAEAVAGQIPVDGLCFHAPLGEGEGKTVHVTVAGKPREVTLTAGIAWDKGHVADRAFKSQPGGAVEIPEAGNFEKDQGFSYGAWVKFTKKNLYGSIIARMEDGPGHRGWDLWLQNGKVATHLVNQWPQDAFKVASKGSIAQGKWNHVFVTYVGSGRVEGLKIYVNGVLQPTDVEANTLKSTLRTSVPFKLAQRNTGGRLDDLLLQDVRLYDRALSAGEVERLAKGTRAAWLAAKPADQRTEAEKNELFSWWLTALDPAARDLNARLNALQQEETAIKARGTPAHVMQEKPQEPMAYVLFRGEYEKRRDPVKPDTPHVLPPMAAGLPKNRLGFAQWLLQPDQPLTARVTVNRFWQEVFGTGIVRTTGDFGASGELPSHPELLDWLAVEFRESGWDVKRFFKLLVTSATYRQAALATPEKLEKDPQNRLLSRGPRFRMDAEMIRDYALAASGLLVRKLGGPSVKPYQPEGVWEAVAMLESNTHDYKRDRGTNLYRRSLYTFWKRSAPPASMEIFNAPSRETCTVRRERTNTPLQALVTLNDVQFIEAARYLAQSALKEGGEKEENRLDFIARRLLARPLRTKEVQVVRAGLADLLAHYKAHPDDAKKLVAVGESKVDPKLDVPTLAAWTMVINELMNLDEVLNK